MSFRKAYDALQQARPAHADSDYLRIVHLAATTSEVDVDAALTLLLEQQRTPMFEAVRELVRTPQAFEVPSVSTPKLDLSCYDALLNTQEGA